MRWHDRVKSFLLIAAAILGFATPGFAQMEKREFNLYQAREFAVAKPAVNETIPDFVMQDLAGNQVRLSDFNDKVIVLVKGGYT